MPVFSGFAAGLLLLLARRAYAAPVDFRRDIEPIFVKRCSECHGADLQKGGLRLDEASPSPSRWQIGNALARARQERRQRADRARDVRRPRRRDARQRRTPDTRSDRPLETMDRRGRYLGPRDNARSHWSFVEPLRPEPPAVRNPAWVRNEIDRFILARLERENLVPSPEADRAMLIR